MNPVKARLVRLEKQIGVQDAGKLVVVRAGPLDDEVEALLAEKGIDADDPRNLIVVLKTVFEDRDGEIPPNQFTAEILHTMDLR